MFLGNYRLMRELHCKTSNHMAVGMCLRPSKTWRQVFLVGVNPMKKKANPLMVRKNWIKSIHEAAA
ncbi:hypothetical protein SD70_32525 [Gordoniibacillus kamchatkensis]|uniref:Uncharacterized protein n=2 Tax=Gordoniibacillus kamchatkensis TaxID=1590651 RepID=A0ABR5A059_9BACL|nr:hypothetical protein SD70_32525 [Paenibacillus sp. VKM B-2647]